MEAARGREALCKVERGREGVEMNCDADSEVTVHRNKPTAPGGYKVGAGEYGGLRARRGDRFLEPIFGGENPLVRHQNSDSDCRPYRESKTGECLHESGVASTWRPLQYAERA